MVGGWVVVHSEFSVLLWSKALDLDLDQAGTKSEIEEKFVFRPPFFHYNFEVKVPFGFEWKFHTRNLS